MFQNSYNKKNHLLLQLVTIILTVIMFFSKLNAQEIISIGEAFKDTDNDYIPDRIGQTVTITGRVNVSSGVLHIERLNVFIQDNSKGINLFSRQLQKTIQEGDSLIVTGVVGQYRGLSQIDSPEYEIINTERKVLKPVDLTILETNSEKYEGMLIRVKGYVVNKGSNRGGGYIILGEENTQMSDSINNNTIMVFVSRSHRHNLILEDYNIGDHLQLTGILGQHDYNKPYNEYYQIYLRYPEDIKTIGLTRSFYRRSLVTGGIVLLLVIAWVITLRVQVNRKTKELKEAENRFRSIYEGAVDAICLTDMELNILHANPSSLKILGYEHNELISMNVRQLLPEKNKSVLLETIKQNGIAEFESSIITKEGNKIDISARINIIEMYGHKHLLTVIRDITEHKKAEAEREKLIFELQDAISKIKTLKGLIPICASCKKIRDDKGYWKQIEVYIRQHSEADFSHGICPECMEKLYPEFVNKDKEIKT